MCQKAGFDVAITDAIQTALWEKFVLLAVNSSVVSLIRLPFGKLREDPDVMALFSASFAEVIAVGRALGVKLPPDMQARMEKAVQNFPPAMKPSMAVDLERGNRLELPWLGGKVVALGKEARGADPGVLGDVRGAEALCERGAGVSAPYQALTSLPIRETVGIGVGPSPRPRKLLELNARHVDRTRPLIDLAAEELREGVRRHAAHARAAIDELLPHRRQRQVGTDYIADWLSSRLQSR